MVQVAVKLLEGDVAIIFLIFPFAPHCCARMFTDTGEAPNIFRQNQNEWVYYMGYIFNYV